MKHIFTLVLLAFVSLGLWAQAPVLTTIQGIQTVSPAKLANCVDSAAFFGDTVRVYATVTMDGNLSRAQGANTRNVWIQSGSSPFSGITVFGSSTTATTPDDIRDLQAGDSVEIVGIVAEFNSESQISPLSVTVVGAANNSVASTLVNLGDLNNNMRINQLPTGEQYEGMFVEIRDVTVTAVTPFSGGSRVSFDVADANGNLINVSDRFLAQRLPANGGSFVAPTVGTRFTSLKGVILHSPNGCKGGTGRGYELNPFNASHYQVQTGSAAPQIAASTRSPITPSSMQNANITATIQDVDGTVVSATLYYAVGVGSTNYNAVSMTNQGGNSWTGQIPSTAYADGDFVKYYICATDNDNLSACNPNVPGGNDPQAFFVRDNGTQIYDIQFTPYGFGNSLYSNLDVTVRGIVTASAETGNLGYVYIQQPGQNQWAGLQLTGNAALVNLKAGDEVSVTGTVFENFGFTRLNSISTVNVISSGNIGQITPVTLSPDIFSTYNFQLNEPYEGMLVRLQNPTAGKRLFVVNKNADAPNRFAEYRIGTDPFSPNQGCRILAGRQTGSAFSSLNVSYINDSLFITSDGVMNVPACVVNYLDSVDAVTGIMHYSFSNMKLTPRNNNDFERYRGVCNSFGVSVDEALSHTVRCYPNPTRGLLHIEYQWAQNLTAEARLIDLSGRVLRSAPATGAAGNLSINTAGLPAGMYLLQLSDGKRSLYRSRIAVQ